MRTIQTEFAERFRGLLAEVGMTQADLARKSGLTISAICRYANGNRLPRADKLALLADALGISAEELGRRVLDERRQS